MAVDCRLAHRLRGGVLIKQEAADGSAAPVGFDVGDERWREAFPVSADAIAA